jgi:RNA polymerase sigma-70 factor (ECF subfamily)
VSDASRDSMVSHYQTVLGFVRRLVRDATLAEDLTQETFLRAQRSEQPDRGEASARSWLCAIALNLVRDHFRTSARRPVTTHDADALDHIPSDHDLERSAAETEMSNCIGEFVLQLPHPQCEVVALHDAAGLTHPEIAAALGITTANSRVLLHRGRAALRELLKRNCVLSFDGDGMPCERRSRCNTSR